MTRIAVVINDLPFLLSHRLPVVLAARDAGLDLVIVAPPCPRSVAILGGHGIPVMPWQMSRGGVGLLDEVNALRALTRIYLALRPDLVHHVTPKPVLYGSIAARLAGIPRVVNAISGMGYASAASPGRRGLVSRISTILHKVAHRGALTRVIVQNPDDAALLLKINAVQPANVRQVRGSGVDPSQWQPAPVLPREAVIVLPARMLEDKGVLETVAAVEILRRKGYSIRLLLAGPVDQANPRAIAAATLQGWTASGVATWLGRVEDMPGLLRTARVVCMPSYYGEGLPKSLIEAASCGIPIITADTPGCREIVRHGDNGLLVPPRDPEAVSAALLSLLTDYDLCVRMGRRGRERVLAEFTVADVVRAHLAIYGELLGGRWPDMGGK
jgi:glycosyltransferase involved in cell wall biosynthesis